MIHTDDRVTRSRPLLEEVHMGTGSPESSVSAPDPGQEVIPQWCGLGRVTLSCQN